MCTSVSQHEIETSPGQHEDDHRGSQRNRPAARRCGQKVGAGGVPARALISGCRGAQCPRRQCPLWALKARLAATGVGRSRPSGPWWGADSGVARRPGSRTHDLCALRVGRRGTLGWGLLRRARGRPEYHLSAFLGRSSTGTSVAGSYLSAATGGHSIAGDHLGTFLGGRRTAGDDAGVGVFSVCFRRPAVSGGERASSRWTTACGGQEMIAPSAKLLGGDMACGNLGVEPVQIVAQRHSAVSPRMIRLCTVCTPGAEGRRETRVCATCVGADPA